MSNVGGPTLGNIQEHDTLWVGSFNIVRMCCEPNLEEEVENIKRKWG